MKYLREGGRPSDDHHRRTAAGREATWRTASVHKYGWQRTNAQTKPSSTTRKKRTDARATTTTNEHFSKSDSLGEPSLELGLREVDVAARERLERELARLE